MSEAKSVVEAVVFAALDQAITGAKVWQDAPLNAGGDLVILGDMKSQRMPGKAAELDRRVTLSIVTIVEADERAPLLALQHQIDTALDGVTLGVPGWTVFGEFLEDDAALAEDGETYNGISSYVFTALAD